MAELTDNFNYLQPTSFKLTVDREHFPNLEFFCQSFTHPGMIMNSVELPYQKVTSVPFIGDKLTFNCLLYTSPSPRDLSTSRMPSSA